MCLAYFFRKKAEESGIKVVNLAYYLSLNTPKREVRLKNAHGEGTAWSCAHGTGRWIRDCGCNTGGGPGWNQKWRGPFRDGMDYLQKEIDQVFVREFIKYFDHPWELRDLYEPCFGDREAGNRFLKEHAKRSIPESVYPYLVSLLEAQRYMLYGYTSCAWFFNDISGIETVQNYRYALRAWQLTWQGVKTNDILRKFKEIAAKAKSNLPGINGKTILHDEVLPMLNHLEKAAFTAAVNSYIYSDKLDYSLHSYEVTLDRFSGRVLEDGDWMLFRVSVDHTVSLEQADFILAILNSRGQEIEGAIFPMELESKLMDETLSFNDLLRQNATVKLNLSDVFTSYKEYITEQFVDEFASENLLDYLSWAGINSNRLDAITELNSGLPPQLAGTVQFFLNKEWDIHITQLVKQRSYTELATSLEEVCSKAKHYGISLNKVRSAHLIDSVLKKDIDALIENGYTPEALDAVKFKVEIVKQFDIPVRFSQLQDRFYLFYKRVSNTVYKEWVADGKKRDEVYDELAQINSLASLFGYSIKPTRL